MDNINPIQLQKQVRDNAEDYGNFVRELKNFEAEMKRKEDELQNEKTSATAFMPPVRKGIKKAVKEAIDEPKASSSALKKISGFDYASWDRFDVDKACADLENDPKLSSEEDEEDEEDEEEEGDEDKEARLREEAIFEKEKGNRFVQSKNWTDAINCYSRAIECYPYDAIYFANRALCYLRTNKLNEADSDCTSSLALDGDYVKAYQRRAAVRLGLGKFIEAREDLLKVMELEPMNTASKTELIKVEKLISASKPIRPNESKHSASGVNESGPPAVKQSGVNDSGLPAVKQSVVNDSGPPVVKMSWGSEDGVKLVQPIHKPPHLRSKKPMQRIEIVEVGRLTSVNSNVCTEVTAAEAVNNVTTGSAVLSTPTESRVDVEGTLLGDSQDHASIPGFHDFEEQVPPLPISSVEFFVGWRKVKDTSELAFMYLKQIPGLDLPNIFQESLEPSTFSEILSVLGTEFVRQSEPVYLYLLGISRVRRLSALTMFMSNADVTNLNTLLKYCVESKQCSVADAASLRHTYELP